MSAKWMSPRVKMKLMQRVKHLLLLCRAVSDLFPIQPEPDFAAFRMRSPAGSGARFSN